MWADNIIRFGFLLFLSAYLVKTAPVTEDLGKLEAEGIQNANLYLINSGLELDGQLGQLQANEANQVRRVSDKQRHQMEMIRQKFIEAREELSLIMQNILNESDLNDIYKPLLTSSDKVTLSNYLNKISQSFDNCDQDNLDFFLIISNYRMNTSPAAASEAASDDRLLLVQNYSKLRVELCWQLYVDKISRNIDILQGKMNVPVFKYIEQVATNMKSRPIETNIKTKLALPKRQAPGSIKIDDSKGAAEIDKKKDLSNLFDPNWTMTSLDSSDSNKLRDTIEALERIVIGSAKEKLEFALGIIRLYKMHAEYVADLGDGGDRFVYKNSATLKQEITEFYENFIKHPCNDLLERMSSILAGGNIFRNHIDQTLGDYLANEKQNNMRLSYELQMYRICKKSNTASEQILKLLISLNR